MQINELMTTHATRKEKSTLLTGRQKPRKDKD